MTSNQLPELPSDSFSDQEFQPLLARVADRPVPRIDVEAMVCNVEQRIQSGVADTVPAAVRQPRRAGITLAERPGRRWPVYASGVAALAVLAMIVPTLFRGSHDSPKRTAAGHTYHTERGQRANFTLPDGSQVILAPDTRLEYLAEADGSRTVALEGQAYFTVTHDPRTPFSIVTGDVTTRVLGTAFSVRAYPTDAVTEVAVAEGRVALAGRMKGELVLHPGDMARAGSVSAPTFVPEAKIADAFGWMRGQLRFNDMPFRDVVVELRRMYDIEISTPGSKLGNRTLTASFSDESITSVLNLVAIGIDATYRRHGDTITFVPKS